MEHQGSYRVSIFHTRPKQKPLHDWSAWVKTSNQMDRVCLKCGKTQIRRLTPVVQKETKKN